MKCATLLLASLASCGDAEPEVYADLPSIEIAAFSVPRTHQLDLLFLVDDSPGDSQQRLAAGMSTLTSRLAALDGSLSLHAGVATSDLGTTSVTDPAHPGPPLGQVGNGGCVDHGKDGVLQTSGAPVTGTFVVDEPGQRNYTGTLDVVLAQMVRVGAGGCGFEQHLAGVERALTNPMNVGFRRPSAELAIVVIGDEDDCSMRNVGCSLQNLPS